MFRYLKDPLCVAAWCLYGANRWLVKPALPADEQFFRGHFNDLLLIPCALPAVLLLNRPLRLRAGEAPPNGFEVAFHLAVWSIFFELLAPLAWGRATGDALDIVAYCAGGLVSWAVWNRKALARPKFSLPAFHLPRLSLPNFSLSRETPRNLTGRLHTLTRTEPAMKTSASILPTILLLLVCAGPAAAQKKLCPAPPPSPFKHSGEIATTFDRASRGMRTTLTHPRLLGPSGAGFYLVASFAHQNPKRPTRLVLELVLVSAGKQPNGRAGALSFVADGKEFPLYGTSAQFQTVRGYDGNSHEAARVALPLDTVNTLLRARKVSARLGGTEVEFTHNHLEALREMASLMSPAYVAADMN
ncbi:MAG TPA: hypothetical protein VGV38_21345 [Pyrinomonadaceae bacterium]|nr:hypothetical protein [Pyrinomonadaceae bacterium]